MPYPVCARSVRLAFLASIFVTTLCLEPTSASNEASSLRLRGPSLGGLRRSFVTSPGGGEAPLRVRAAALAAAPKPGAALQSSSKAPAGATTVAALRTYPLFFDGQRVRVRGALDIRPDAAWLTSGDREILIVGKITDEKSARVEVSGTCWDVGRHEPTDPRLASFDLQRISRTHVDKDWPGIGELLVIAADGLQPADSSAQPTIRSVALEPERFDGEAVVLLGRFRGRNLYGDLPNAPGKSRWDFVLQSGDAAVWVTGLQPRGKRFNLNVDARVDTSRWLEVRGVVRRGNGLVWIEATQVALAEAPGAQPEPEPPPPPPKGPSPEVIFSAPVQDEADVSPTTTVRIQFSRDIKPETLEGRVRVSYIVAQSIERGEPQPPPIEMSFTYDDRILQIRFAQPLDRFRTLKVELLEGIEATDGAPLKPWTLTFALGG
ncbi:MAG: Ig-like domain-containing protein [Acidobacteria bacterium]|nr:Ig-like domain-containing protein [Acidobacteriota bacterium]